MKTLIAIFLFLTVTSPSPACGPLTGQSQTSDRDGILQSIENATVSHSGDMLLVKRKDAQASIEIGFVHCQGLGVSSDRNQWWVLPISAAGEQIDANHALWILPTDAQSKDHAWYLTVRNGSMTAKMTDAGLLVTVHGEDAKLSKAEARPHSDPFGHRFSFDFAGGTELADTLAAFYWGTMLPSVVEKTMAAHFPYHDGYVLSTLNIKSYAGSYPAVDHEFQIKGRLAFGSDADLDIVRRMIELQFKLMNDDPEELHRAPTSVQPDGRREYHVRRDSQDHRQNAGMFPLTGDIEVIEEAWRYYEARKDAQWLRANIENLEHAADWILANTDQYGRVWSDVYYEDQVIKDGRVTQAQAFAAHALSLLAEMEKMLNRADQADRFEAASKRMSAALIGPLPMGYWDVQNQRFIDWVDRDGVPHDHIHLLANELPVTFGYATTDQAKAVGRLIDENAVEFERFPSFVSAKIGDYTKSEIGTGGPYDLCGAGRYWYWDAEYRPTQKQNGLLLDQLKAVAAEAAKNGYFMSERYDMDHVYYIDGKDAHGAEKYYEYPNVFAAVLIGKYLGLDHASDADVSIAPHLAGEGSVELDIPTYAVRYSYTTEGFTLKNLSDHVRKFDVDLSALNFHATHFRLERRTEPRPVGPRSSLSLSAGEEAHWSPLP